MMYLLLFFVSLLVYYIFNFYRTVKRYPKGPVPLPFIGNLHQIDFKIAHIQFAELSKRYGNVYTLFLPRPFVILADYGSIKEAFSNNDDFAGRSGLFPDIVFQNVENGGVIFSQGENWKEQRRFSLKVLRDFGMGKSVMEEMVASSVENCLAHLKSLNTEQGLDLLWPLQLFVGNIITKILFNFMFKYNDCDKLRQFVINQAREFDTVKNTHPLIMLLSQNFPSVLKLPIIGNLLVGHYYEIMHKNHTILREFIRKTREDFKPEQEPECFSHAYIKKLGSSPYFTEEHMLNVCSDFYGAGQETTTTTLRWAMLFLAQHQDVQDKMRAEISNTIGFDRLPSMKDKQHLPYANAAISEIQRLANLAPLNVNHRTVKNTQVGGISIPEDTIVIGLLSNVLWNSYQDGDKFLPERFLMEDGVTPNKEALERCIPFSIGKRICAGESLARVELFIGIVGILQHFKILPMPETEVDLSPHVSIVLMPKSQKLRLIPMKKY